MRNHVIDLQLYNLPQGNNNKQKEKTMRPLNVNFSAISSFSYDNETLIVTFKDKMRTVNLNSSVISGFSYDNETLVVTFKNNL